MVPSAFAEEVLPQWIKNNAGWWADGQIPDSEYNSELYLFGSNGGLITNSAFVQGYRLTTNRINH